MTTRTKDHISEKEYAVSLIQAMVPDVTLEEIVDELEFRLHLKQSLQDVEDGRLISHEEVRKQFGFAPRSLDT